MWIRPPTWIGWMNSDGSRVFSLNALLRAAEAGQRPDSAEALSVLIEAPADDLLAAAESLTLAGFGTTVTYSRKVFIPLTQLCRDVCHYCTFAKAPRRLKGAYLTAEEVLAIARAGQAVDCKEALFTLGDKPEDRYAVARTAWMRWVPPALWTISGAWPGWCWRRPGCCPM